MYEVSAEVQPSGTAVDVLNVTALIDGMPFPLSNTSGMTWTGNVAVNPCQTGFDLVYEAEWDAPLSGGTEVEPVAGVTQKWITGDPPASCPVTFGSTFSVNSTADAPDHNPGDGLCATGEDTCTLRAAVMEANATPGTDRILVASGTYALTLSGTDDTAALGDLDVLESMTIESDGFLATIDAAGLGDRVFDIFGGREATVTLHRLAVRGGQVAGPGGGIRNRSVLFLERVRIEDNRTAPDIGNPGGGVYTEGPLFATETRIRQNTAGHFGGGLVIYGGATTVLTRSAITENTALIQHGGGVAIIDGAVEAYNTTISGNEASVYGGGVYANTDSRVTFINVTIARNRADNNGGGFLFAGSTYPLRLGHAIVAENYKGFGTTPSDCWGTIFSLGYNLIEETSGCTLEGVTGNTIAGANQADLHNLGFWGGPTRVHRLQTSSAARDAGNPSLSNDASFFACRTQDQRGESRLTDGGGGSEAVCDIGGVEMQ